MRPALRLLPRKAHPLWLGHPWVLRGSVQRVEGDPELGDTVDVFDAEGRRVGVAWFTDSPALLARMLDRDDARLGPSGPPPVAFWVDRIRRAADARRAWGLPAPDTDAFRLLNGEGDATPGVLVDVFGETVVLHVTTQAAWRSHERIVEALREVLAPVAILVQTDASMARLENLPPVLRAAHGTPPDRVTFLEGGVRYAFAPFSLQKTGHYLDQRENRRLFGRLAAGRRVLDACCYTGSFALHAARAGASRVVALDSSGPAISAARENEVANGGGTPIAWLQEKAEDAMRRMAGIEDERFDLISLDPPKLAPGRGDREAAARKYEMLCRQAIGLLAQGGRLLVASCSSAVDAEGLLGVLSSCVGRAHRTMQVEAVTGHAPDHPFPPAMREGRYLSSVLVRLDG